MRIRLNPYDVACYAGLGATLATVLRQSTRYASATGYGTQKDINALTFYISSKLFLASTIITFVIIDSGYCLLIR